MGKDIPLFCAFLVAGAALLAACGGEDDKPEGGAEADVAYVDKADPSYLDSSQEIVVQRLDLPPLDFRKAARAPRFRQAVEQFESESDGRRVKVDGIPGAAGFRVDSEQADRELVDWSEKFRSAGAYVFRYDATFGYGRDAVVLLPTDDQWVVLDAAGTDGTNWDLTHAEIVRELRKLHREYPFRLTEAGLDFVAGPFEEPVRDANALAKRLYRFCPDIVDQGTETVAALANELEQSQALYCWWD